MATTTPTNDPMPDAWNSMMNSGGAELARVIQDQVTGVLGNVKSFVDEAEKARIEAIGQTPDAMIENFAANEHLQSEDGQKLIQIMKDDPKFTKAFHNAMINEPDMAPGILGLADPNGQAAGGPSLTDIVAGLSDDGNRAKFTKVLDAVAQDPNDDLNFKYTMEVAGAAHKASQPGVQQDDYKNLRDILLRANIKDPMLDIAADPKAALEDFMRDPSGFMKQMADSLITMEGPLGDMMRGFIHGMGQYIELIVSPEIVEFYGKHVDPLVKDAIEKSGLNEKGVQAGAEAGTAIVAATSKPEVASTVPIGPTTPDQQKSTMWQSFKSEINVENLVGSGNDVTSSIKHKAMNAFESARSDAPPTTEPEVETSPVFKQPQANFDSMRMGAFGP